MAKRLDIEYFRNIMLGAEDSLVSTVGVMFGLATSGEYTSRLLIIAGMVLVSVEALSMGVGAYLSETEIHELDLYKKHTDIPTVGGVIMFLSYLGFGTFAMLPYFFVELHWAKYLSVILTLVALFLLGFIPTKKSADGMRMAIIAGLAILLGFTVARLFSL